MVTAASSEIGRRRARSTVQAQHHWHFDRTGGNERLHQSWSQHSGAREYAQASLQKTRASKDTFPGAPAGAIPATRLQREPCSARGRRYSNS
jgi:hypothetical protein